MSKKSEAKKKRDSAERKRANSQKIISTGKIKGKKAKPAEIAAAKKRVKTHSATMR